MNGSAYYLKIVFDDAVATALQERDDTAEVKAVEKAFSDASSDASKLTQVYARDWQAGPFMTDDQVIDLKMSLKNVPSVRSTRIFMM